MTNKEIAATILEQLGGNRFIAFTGSKDFIATEDGGLLMTLARNASRANRLRITLTGMDDYNMEFIRHTPWHYSTRGGQFREYPEKTETVKRFDHVFCDQLQELFTDVTHLYTHF